MWMYIKSLQKGCHLDALAEFSIEYKVANSNNHPLRVFPNAAARFDIHARPYVKILSIYFRKIRPFPL